MNEPTSWLVIFHRSSTRWVARLTPGRYKHVSLAGFVPDAGAWVHLSSELARLRVDVVADADFERWLAATVSADAGVFRVPAPAFDVGPWRPRLGLTCCSMASHVLGLSGGALLPDGLWRLLVAQGAEIVTDGQSAQTENPGPVRGRDGGGRVRQPRAA